MVVLDEGGKTSCGDALHVAAFIVVIGLVIAATERIINAA
jgi:hypothetical protein